MSPAVLGVAVAMGFVVAAVNTVNDLVDASSDRVGRPTRPLPSGRVTGRGAGVLAVLCAAAAVVVVADRGAEVTRVVVGLLALGTLYSLVFKSSVLVGNAVVAMLEAGVLVLGALIADGVTAPLWVGCAALFGYLLGYEVLKTGRDLVADASVGCVTVATRWGIPPVIWLLRAILLAAAVVGVTPWVLGWAGWPYLLLIGPGTLGPAIVGAWRISPDASHRHICTLLRVMVFGWIPGLLALATLA